MEQTFDDRINEALDAIEQGVTDLRSILEEQPVRDLGAEVKSALDTFVSTVTDALTKAQEVLDRNEEGETPGDESGPGREEGEDPRPTQLPS